MRSVFFYASILLIPVILLLFIALKMRKKVTYPHGLIFQDKNDKPTDFLIRFLKLYGDLFFDVAIALSVSFFLAGYPQARFDKIAVILDSSLSMTRGFPGARAMDLAVRELFENPEYGSSDLYLLEYDELSSTTRLFKANKLKINFNSPLSLARELDDRNKFFSIDYSVLSELKDKHYKKIILLTDNENIQTGSIEVKLFKAMPIVLSYPAQAFYDASVGESVVHFYSRDSSRLERILRMDPDHNLLPAEPDSFRIEKTPSGFVLRTKNPGIWAVRENGYTLPFNAPGAPKSAGADGILATKIRDIISGIPREPDPEPKLLLISETKRGQRPNALRIATSAMDSCVIDPGKTLGAMVASGYKESAEITLTPTSFATADSSLFFLTELQKSNEGIFAETKKTALPIRLGDGFLVQKKPVPYALHAEPDEYFPFAVTIPSPKALPLIPRYVIFIFLCCVYALKSLFAVKSLPKRR